MFHQVIGDGASLFITIVAVVIGFVGALTAIDFERVKKEQEEKGQGN